MSLPAGTRGTVLGLALLLGAWAPLAAQTVVGRLVADEDEAPVSGAVVGLIEADTAGVEETVALGRAVTGAEGTFGLEAPAAGRYRLRAGRIGFEETTSPPLDVRTEETVEVELRMAREAVLMAPLTVVSDRPPLVLHPRLLQSGFHERKDRYGKYGFGHFLEGEDLPRSAWYASDLIRDLPGVYVVSVGRRERVIRCRRVRRGQRLEMTFYLDGTAVGAGSADALNQWITPSQVVGVEVYPGMVGPSESGVGGACSVMVWTGVRD